jgi:hypothetical protein
MNNSYNKNGDSTSASKKPEIPRKVMLALKLGFLVVFVGVAVVTPFFDLILSRQFAGLGRKWDLTEELFSGLAASILTYIYFVPPQLKLPVTD